MKSLRKVESLIEKIKPLDPPERFEKRDGEIYGLKAGEWKKYTLEELTALKDTVKARYEQSLKRFDPMEIDVRAEMRLPNSVTNNTVNTTTNGLTLAIHSGDASGPTMRITNLGMEAYS